RTAIRISATRTDRITRHCDPGAAAFAQECGAGASGESDVAKRGPRSPGEDAHYAMDDWKVNSYADTNNRPYTSWVYYQNSNFQGIHFSRHVNNNSQDHMATDDRTYYY